MAREPDLNALGRAVAEAQDAELAGRGARDRERVRSALLADAGARGAGGPRSPARHALVPALVAVAAAIAVVLLWPPSSERAGFQVGRSPGRVGAWIAAPEARKLPVTFADGTRVVLSAGGRARVAEVGPHGGQVVLERGQAHVAVVHGKARRWLLHVGPYEVVVVGTRFDVSWDPSSEQFDLSMQEGRVRVTGPMLDEGRSVAAGESLTAAVRTHRLTVAAAETETDSETDSETETDTETEAETEAEAETDTETETETDTARTASASPAGARVAADWAALARAGKFAEAIGAAEAAGFERICATASAGDLVLLGDAARFGGRLPRAVGALEALRRRFAGSPLAAQAAFTLGRIAFDRRHAHTEAARWFATYLREAPGGPLAREASGRRLEALVRASDVAGARAAAEQYLARYPNGPHAALARRFGGP